MVALDGQPLGRTDEDGAVISCAVGSGGLECAYGTGSQASRLRCANDIGALTIELSPVKVVIGR